MSYNGAVERHDVVIVGAGIAGASLAYFLADRGVTDVLVLEREEHPGHHASGRSAETFVSYDPVLALEELKLAARPWFVRPPAGFADVPLLRPIGVLVLVRGDSWARARGTAARLSAGGARAEILAPEGAREKVPALAAAEIEGAVWLPEDGAIETSVMLERFLRRAQDRGARLRCSSRVTDVLVERGRCVGVRTSEGEVRARVVVNAAGAWAGELGRMAGASPIELSPRRRTLVTFAAPDGVRARECPLVVSESHRVYFGPEAGGLKACPMDEDPSEPCDARPDDAVIAAGIERLRALAPALAPSALRRKWAGLRTFAPDRVPVVGDDPRRPGFFWLAGQGGCGFETAPIVSAVAADLALRGRTDLFDAARLAPDRFG